MTSITDTVPDGIAALRDLCDALSPELAAGIQRASAYEGVGPTATWRVGTGDAHLHLVAQIDAQVGPIDWMLSTYPDDHVIEIRSGMAHGVLVSVVTDTDLLHADGTTTPALAEGVSL